MEYAYDVRAWTARSGLLSVCSKKAAGLWRNVVWTMQRLPRPACIFGGFCDVLAAPQKWSQAMGRTRLGRKICLHFASCPFLGFGERVAAGTMGIWGGVNFDRRVADFIIFYVPFELEF